MDKLQLLFFFSSGFLISRLIIKTGMPQVVVAWFLDRGHDSLTGALLSIIAVSAFLSLLIPNAITVLTLLPVLELLRSYYQKHYPEAPAIPTMLALATIYGANIGGMGSITATPANGILASFAELNAIAGADNLGFSLWLLWGVPLVVILVLVAWLVIVVSFRSWRYDSSRLSHHIDLNSDSHPHRRIAAILSIFYFLSSILLSALIVEMPRYEIPVLVASALVTAGLLVVLFMVPVANAASGRREHLLTIADLYSNLPLRGFLFVGISVAVALLLYVSGAGPWFAQLAQDWIPSGSAALEIYLLLALITTFATELLSNTAVQLSLFVMIPPLALTAGVPALPILLVVSLSSTAAFMSPIATGVNGLAFGGIRGVSFVRMLLAGLAMNIAGALIISLWVLTVAGPMID